jgi:hypothetical protein
VPRDRSEITVGCAAPPFAVRTPPAAGRTALQAASRGTVPLHQATTTADIGEREMEHLASLVAKGYEKGDFVGSLVVPGPGDARRPTAWDGASPPPAELSWWDFPGLVERWWRHGRDPKERKEPAGIRQRAEPTCRRRGPFATCEPPDMCVHSRG